MTAPTRSHVAAIGAVLAGLVLVGCANPEALDQTTTPEDSLARVQGAAARVTEARSARLSMTMTTTFAGEEVAASTATTELAF
jgi:outer membrane murein-binding lipoprotein Lpp